MGMWGKEVSEVKVGVRQGWTVNESCERQCERGEQSSLGRAPHIMTGPDGRDAGTSGKAGGGGDLCGGKGWVAQRTGKGGKDGTIREGEGRGL